jgi:osmotically-inducible protein OsmY
MQCWKTHMAAPAACALFLCFGIAASAAAEDQKLDDSDISLAVETQLIIEDAVPAHNIDVSTNDGVVTLSGSVDSYYAKLAAEDEAESVKGVLAVVNDLEVKPLVRLDSQIRGDVISKLAIDPVTESYELNVDVDDGVVTLSGTVDSYSEKAVAEEVAEGVKGVKEVVSLVTYEPVSDRADSDVKHDIEYRLRADASIDAGLITVQVDDGEVTLDGSVGSATEKSAAVTEAWMVPGVTSVENHLDVEWWRDGATADWEPGWTDEDMQQAIEAALLTNPRVKSFNVVTRVDDGVATLTGTVDNLQAKAAAEEEADDVLGVRRVRNFLRVRPLVTRADAQAADDVREALRRDPYVDRYGVSVSVYNGRAHLTGEVDSWYMKSRAEDVASEVAGVVDVQNSLDVDYEFTAKTDQEIKEDVESELWWSPFVDSDDITVEVHSGVVTLMGTVEDWDELQAAKENAREGGATKVISKLKIENGYGAN